MFLSPDPTVSNPADTQSYVRYSYANNNPRMRRSHLILVTGLPDTGKPTLARALAARYGVRLTVRTGPALEAGVIIMGMLTSLAMHIRLLRSCLNGPVYIPDQGRYVIKLLESGGPDQMVAELERLSSLGSFWASAVLGYLSLFPEADGRRNPSRAIELCRAGAAGGDPYALFVLAWALLLSGRRNSAIKAMKKAALAGFPPATLDYITFVWNGWGTSGVYPSAAITLLRRANSINHKAAMIWKCTIYGSGKFGAFHMILGRVGMPFARLKYLFATLLDPFSCRVLVFQVRATGSPLRRQVAQHQLHVHAD